MRAPAGRLSRAAMVFAAARPMSGRATLWLRRSLVAVRLAGVARPVVVFLRGFSPGWAPVRRDRRRRWTSLPPPSPPSSSSSLPLLPLQLSSPSPSASSTRWTSERLADIIPSCRRRRPSPQQQRPEAAPTSSLRLRLSVSRFLALSLGGHHDPVLHVLVFRGPTRRPSLGGSARRDLSLPGESLSTYTQRETCTYTCTSAPKSNTTPCVGALETGTHVRYVCMHVRRVPFSLCLSSTRRMLL